MPTFVLKKYEPQETQPEQVTDEQAQQLDAKNKEHAKTIEISASDSIGKIVAQALYKAIPNIDIIRKVNAERGDSSQSETTAVSTEQINSDPAGTLLTIGKHVKCVLILNDGFKTAQEEWFLQSLENRQIKPFYTVVSFVRYVQTALA